VLVPFMRAVRNTVRGIMRRRRMKRHCDGENTGRTTAACPLHRGSVDRPSAACPCVPTRMICFQRRSPVSSLKGPPRRTPACGGCGQRFLPFLPLKTGGTMTRSNVTISYGAGDSFSKWRSP
jgi:hypothetical protein